MPGRVPPSRAVLQTAHSLPAWDPNNRVFLYNSTPIGAVGPPDPGQFWLFPDKDAMRPQDAAIFRSSDFVWSIPFCAIDAAGKSNCAVK
jgi:hypothetical protein